MNNHINFLFTILILAIIVGVFTEELHAQESKEYFEFTYNEEQTKFLDDPSFEIIEVSDLQYLASIKHWQDCGRIYFPKESVVGKKSNIANGFSPAFPPSHGNFYLELIARENATWEGISQELNIAVEAQSCCQFDIDIRREAVLATLDSISYTDPICLQIGLSNHTCRIDQLILDSKIIEHTEWETYTVRFEPEESFSYLTIRAIWDLSWFEYNGNVMIDNIKNFREVECTDDGK